MDNLRVNSRYIKSLNYEILKNLNPSIASTPFKQGKIIISAAWANQLRHAYGICGRFKPIETFLHDHNIITQRYYDTNNYCEIRNGSFQMRVGSHRKIKYLNQELQLNTIQLSTKILSFKFVRENNTN